jgi:hypothetical protein
MKILRFDNSQDDRIDRGVDGAQNTIRVRTMESVIGALRNAGPDSEGRAR